MPTDLLVLPSPLLPAAAYEPLVRALSDRGYRCRVAECAAVTSPVQVIDRWSEQSSASTRFVAHSNAGYLAPSVRAAVGSGGPIVFMDAALPPADGDTALVPEALRHHLVSMADPTTGMLPPWTRWWPQAEMLQTVPRDAFEGIDSRCPRLPLSYFEARVQAPAGWTERDNAYLGFGATYADQVDQARRLGWPTRTIDGSHLEFLWDVDVVAAAVMELVGTEDEPDRPDRGPSSLSR